MRLVAPLLCVLAIAAPAYADKLRVAVVPGIAVNLDASRVDALSQDLAEALNEVLDINAIGGLEVRRQLKADGLPPDCVTNPTCTGEVARATGATQLLFVVMVDSGAGGSIQIDTTWIEPSTGHTASRPAIDLTTTADAEAKAKFAEVATQLLPDAPLKPKPKSDSSGNNNKLVDGTPRHLTTPAMITGAVAVGGLAIGLTLGLVARSKYNTCDANFNTCDDAHKSSIRTFDLAADVGWFVLTGAAIATVVLYATSAEGPHVIVTPTPEGAGVAAFGRF